MGASLYIIVNIIKLLLNPYLDFIKSGAEVIVTTVLVVGNEDLSENGLVKEYKKLNVLAGKLGAKKAVAKSKKKVLIAGSLPPQNFHTLLILEKILIL